ncbi:MAG TPA: RDD family protein [Microlunatus sp.]|nr:RDD family protein [Microlunatus sp.]
MTTEIAVPVEARPYQGRPAGLVSRSLAAAVDLAVVLVVMVGLYLGWTAVRLLVRPTQFTFPDPSLLLSIAVGFSVSVVYLTVGWTMVGRTYGDHVMGLRVVDHRGSTLHLPAALIRSVACALFPIGLLWTAVSARNLSIQDIVLRTAVRYDWHTSEPGSGRLPAGAAAS